MYYLTILSIRLVKAAIVNISQKCYQEDDSLFNKLKADAQLVPVPYRSVNGLKDWFKSNPVGRSNFEY
jgi:hypothetical protein